MAEGPGPGHSVSRRIADGPSPFIRSRRKRVRIYARLDFHNLGITYFTSFGLHVQISIVRSPIAQSAGEPA
eukprot:583713-Pyramimonas_sp.AAC.1